MTQITAAEQQRLQAATERAMTTLAACVDNLPAEERAVLDAVLGQLEVADRRVDDTAGHIYSVTAWLVNQRRREIAIQNALEPINSINWQSVYDALGA